MQKGTSLEFSLSRSFSEGEKSIQRGFSSDDLPDRSANDGWTETRRTRPLPGQDEHKECSSKSKSCVNHTISDGLFTSQRMINRSLK